MKVCIIGHTERNYLPYMERYVQFFEENGIDHDIICWQREESLLSPAANEYRYFEEPKEGAFNKLLSYMRFKKFVTEKIKENKYDKLIILSTLPCVILKKLLLKEYAGKYLFDIRDYSFERFSPYKKLVDRLIAHSEFTTISSRGFLDFLEQSPKIFMNHNISFAENVDSGSDIREKAVLNIGFIGGVRYFEENVALINRLKDSFRYQLWYIGQPTKDCNLEGYCKEHGIKNVSFVGKYDNNQKTELYRNIDMINSIYGDDTLEVTTALPNRLYEACLLKKPIISSKATYLGEVIDHYDLGLVVNVEKDDVLTMLDQYVNSFDPNEFMQGCESFLEDVKKDDAILFGKLREFVEKKDQ